MNGCPNRINAPVCILIRHVTESDDYIFLTRTFEFKIYVISLNYKTIVLAVRLKTRNGIKKNMKAKAQKVLRFFSYAKLFTNVNDGLELTLELQKLRF